MFVLFKFNHFTPGWDDSDFKWDKYLERTGAKAAPEDLFDMVRLYILLN